MSATPKVSFVVPCYKYGHYLPQCIRSILEQTERDLEVIIMDDCSPDNTAEVSSGFSDERVRYYRQKVNVGAINNINDGIRHARGAWTWVLSADDALARKDALARYLDLTFKHPSLGFVFSPALVLQEDKILQLSVGTIASERGNPTAEPRMMGGFENRATAPQSDSTIAGKEVLVHLAAANIVPACSSMIRTECLRSVGCWPNEFRRMPDHYLWARLAARFDVGFVVVPVSLYRAHPQSEWQGYLKNVPLEVRNEALSMRWRIVRDTADLAIKQRCMDALAEQYAILMAVRAGDPADPLGMTWEGIENSLSIENATHQEAEAIQSKVRKILPRVLRWQGAWFHLQNDSRRAMRCYRQSLRIAPFNLKTLVRFLLFQLNVRW